METHLFFADRVCVARQLGKVIVPTNDSVLSPAGYRNLLTATSAELDLYKPVAVQRWLAGQQPNVVWRAAANLVGIAANYAYQAVLLLEDLKDQSKVIEKRWRGGVLRLLFLGGSRICTKDADQPSNARALPTRTLRPTNEWSGIVKITGIKLHAALVRFLNEAAQANTASATCPSTGTPVAVCLHLDHPGDACVPALEHCQPATEGLQVLKVGIGRFLPIRELADQVAGARGCKVEVPGDGSKSGGSLIKQLNPSRMVWLDWWRAQIPLAEGLGSTGIHLVRRGITRV